MNVFKTLPQAKWTLVTPHMAQEMLAGNTDNRAISVARVHDLKLSIMQGMWIPNNDAIVVSETGRLLNGQHRLTAISKANRAVLVLVIIGAPEGMRVAMDTGRSRAGCDVIAEDKGLIALARFFVRERIGRLSREQQYVSPHRLQPMIDLLRPVYEVVSAKHPNKRRVTSSVPVRAAFAYSWLDRSESGQDLEWLMHIWDTLSGRIDAPPTKVAHAFVQSKLAMSETQESAFLRALRVFDRGSQEHSRIKEMNKMAVRERIERLMGHVFNQIFSVPPRLPQHESV